MSTRTREIDYKPPLEGRRVPLVGKPSEHFTWEELRCRHTKLYPNLTPAVAAFLGHLDLIRGMYGPMKITSGFRHRNHPIETKKARPGTHALGLAVDVRTGSSAATFALVDAVFRLLAQDHIPQDQFGVGIAGNRFVHIDQGGPAARGPRPALWTYSAK